VISIFALPLLVGNIVQQVYQLTDAAVVGRLLGVHSLAAVGVTTSFVFLLIGFSWGLATGFAIPTAQAIGANNPKAVRRSVATGTLLTAICSLLLTICGPFLAEPMLVLLQTPAELLHEATTFARITLLGSSALMFFNYVAAIIRATGDSRTPLLFQMLSCALNAGLVVVFVGPLGLDVAGAAGATVTAQAVTVMLCLHHIRRKVPALQITGAHWRPNVHNVRKHLHMGLPMGLQASIIATGSLAVQTRLNELGSEAVASYTTAARVDSLAVALLQSLGLAVSLFVAQNLGAQRPDRIRTGVKQALLLAVGTAAAVGVLLIGSGPLLIRLFVGENSNKIVETAMTGLALNGSLYTILGVLFVLRGALQGLGYSLVPTATGVLELAARLTTALLLAPSFGYAGVIWGTPLAWTGAVLLLVPTYFLALRRLSTQATFKGPLPPALAPSNATR
jgi:putative MATE family efflux protein